MRIDREAFLLAAWTLAGTLAGCERAEEVEEALAPVVVAPEAPKAPAPTAIPKPASIAVAPTPVEPVVAPKPKSVRMTPKRWFASLSATQQTNVTSVCEARRSDPCAALWAKMPRPRRIDGTEVADEMPRPREVVKPSTPSPEDTFLAALSAPQRQQVVKYCDDRNSKMPSPTCETPLVVAFDEQPIELRTSAGEFAFVPGEPMASSWPTAATPWIARDLDGDGRITSGAELFGSSTLVEGALASNGFEALAALDANRDGVIDAKDPEFGSLLLWSDRDGNRRSSADELRLLNSVVTSIPLAHTLDARCHGGDCEGERGTLRWRDGTTERTGAVVDVYLRRR